MNATTQPGGPGHRFPPVISHDTPIGKLTLAASAQGLTRARLHRAAPLPKPEAESIDPSVRRWLDQARRELDEYFAGRRHEFSVPVDLSRVELHHRRVLDYLADVGYGRTSTYGALATALGLTEDGPRRVGAAMARNPVLIVVPCHRILGAGGKLTGYAGGPGAKRWLLDLEGREHTPQLDLHLEPATRPGVAAMMP